MKDIMSDEVTEMIRTLEKANRALERILGVEEEEGECTRCWRDVPESELVKYGDWKLCEECQGDI